MTNTERLARNQEIVARQMQRTRIEGAAARFQYAIRHDAPEASHVAKFLAACLAIGGVISARHGI